MDDSSSIDEGFALAVEHHKEGRYVEAEQVYRRILSEMPNHTDANHNLGILAIQLGQAEQGLPFLMAAWESNPEIAQYWMSLADCLINVGRPVDAIKIIQGAISNGLGSKEMDQLLDRAQEKKPKVDVVSASQGSNEAASPEQKKSSGKKSKPIKVRGAPSPQDAATLTAHFQSGRFPAAIEQAQQWVAHWPKQILGWNVLVASLASMGRLVEAEAYCRQAIELLPKNANLHNDLGAVQYEAGNFEGAAKSCRVALNINPNFVEAYNNLGNAYKEIGQLDEAESAYRRALELKPDFTIVHNNLGNVLQKLGRLEDAERSIIRALEGDPNYAEAHNNLGAICLSLGRLKEAEGAFSKALEIRPNYPEAQRNLAYTAREGGDYLRAEQLFRKAIELRPDDAKAHNNLGALLKASSRLSEAAASFRKTLELQPDYAEAHNNLGVVLMDLGYPVEAEACYQKALTHKPDFNDTENNRLFCINYRTDLTGEEIFEWYRRYGDNVTRKVAGNVVRHGDWSWDGKRKLRIGYLSPDFRGHACRFFMEPFLREHDKSKFEVFAYSNVDHEDRYTQNLKGYCDCWRDIYRLSDSATVEQIANDKIDILVDLAGHSKGNRLMVFGYRPAPIQVTYMGYDATTGLKEIDYFLADEQLIPKGSEHLFSEEVWRLPVMMCYEPPRELTPDVVPLPALSNGFITFGSMLRVIRLNSDVTRVWSEILKRVPGSRLRLYHEPFKYPDMRKFFAERFTQHSIDPERISLDYISPHWNGYNKIDIALDAFPNNGGATTIEALWMGVPVLTKRGCPPMGTFGASILHPIGLDDWISDTEDEYIRKAIKMSEDIEALANTRSELRQRFEASPHLDVEGFTRSLETAYTNMVKARQLACPSDESLLKEEKEA